MTATGLERPPRTTDIVIGSRNNTQPLAHASSIAVEIARIDIDRQWPYCAAPTPAPLTTGLPASKCWKFSIALNNKK